jgi:predicted ArsR family transcriptional regulator
MTSWNQRFLTSTRGRIVVLLRRKRGTVDDLASALGLTDNAIRAHLTTLERDGLVHQVGVRRGEGKPSVIYSLTQDAERLFPKAYAPVLGRLMDVLEERVSVTESRAMLREVGRRLALEHPQAKGAPVERLTTAAALLSALGGLAEVDLQASNGTVRLQGYSCPLGAIIPEHPEICLVAESLIAEVTGLPVRECCDRQTGEPPRCAFEVDHMGD